MKESLEAALPPVALPAGSFHNWQRFFGNIVSTTGASGEMIENATFAIVSSHNNLCQPSLKFFDTPGPKGVRILELITALSGFPYLGLTRLCLNRTY